MKLITPGRVYKTASPISAFRHPILRFIFHCFFAGRETKTKTGQDVSILSRKTGQDVSILRRKTGQDVSILRRKTGQDVSILRRKTGQDVSILRRKTGQDENYPQRPSLSIHFITPAYRENVVLVINIIINQTL